VVTLRVRLVFCLQNQNTDRQAASFRFYGIPLLLHILSVSSVELSLLHACYLCRENMNYNQLNEVCSETEYELKERSRVRTTKIFQLPAIAGGVLARYRPTRRSDSTSHKFDIFILWRIDLFTTNGFERYRGAP
jgi:hypothetical protein